MRINYAVSSVEGIWTETKVRALFGENRIACALQQPSYCWAHCLYKADFRRSRRNFASALAGKGVQGELPQTPDQIVTFLPLGEACDAGRRISDQILVACALLDAVDTSSSSMISESCYTSKQLLQAATMYCKITLEKRRHTCTGTSRSSGMLYRFIIIVDVKK